MKNVITAILNLIIATLFAGCSVEVTTNAKSETDMGSHHVVVKPRSTFTSSSSMSSGDTETHQFTCGEISITIRNEELIVNNVKYGKLENGQAVLIDNGKVFVADKERQGTPMSDEEVVASASVKQSTKELAGYNVTVRPGSSFTSTSQVLSKHTFTVGKTKVSIKKDELFVNGESYGKLKTGDTIVVENKKVSVSGEVREAKQ